MSNMKAATDQHPKILFATSEIFPLVKTGGLADFSHGLTRALQHAKSDIIILIPGYRELIAKLKKFRLLATVDPAISGKYTTDILESKIPGTTQKLWIVSCATLYDRDGKPYSDQDGADWPDNAQRFAHFCKIGAAIASGDIDLGWRPDIVHCNDWQTGLIPAFLHEAHGNTPLPKTVFTIHNLAYQGNFSGATFAELQLPWHWWSFDKIEFHNQMSFLKGALSYADRITTVSPNYAEEIMQPPLSCGMEGALNYRRSIISGILNGVDYKTWNPSNDELIYSPYRKNQFGKKTANKLAFFAEHGFSITPEQPLFGYVGRLAHQKGIELLLYAIDYTVDQGAAWAILGTGEKRYEAALRKIAARHPEAVSLNIGYDESCAHQIEAAADMFLMPSLYEPCGLNQMYSLKYGTVPIVSRTGGLIDTVVDTHDDTIANKTATGFIFDCGSTLALRHTLDRALALFGDKKRWQQLQKNAMNCDFSWDSTAEQYLALYARLLQSRGRQVALKVV